MQQRIGQLVAGFAITGTLLAALCGFTMVDLRGAEYMPEGHGALLRVVEIGAGGLRLELMGEEYALVVPAEAKELLWQERGMLPRSVTLTANLVARGYEALREALETPEIP